MEGNHDSLTDILTSLNNRFVNQLAEIFDDTDIPYLAGTNMAQSNTLSEMNTPSNNNQELNIQSQNSNANIEPPPFAEDPSVIILNDTVDQQNNMDDDIIFVQEFRNEDPVVIDLCYSFENNVATPAQSNSVHRNPEQSNLVQSITEQLIQVHSVLAESTPINPRGRADQRRMRVVNSVRSRSPIAPARVRRTNATNNVDQLSNQVANSDHFVSQIGSVHVDLPTPAPTIQPRVQKTTENEITNTASTTSGILNSSQFLKCPICLESCINSQPATTGCGHIFCRDCIITCVRTTFKCPICKKKQALKDIRRIFI